MEENNKPGEIGVKLGPPPLESTPRMSATIGKLAFALAKAQGQMENAKKDRANPFFKSRYADLASNWDTCRKPLADNELAVVQTFTDNEFGKVRILTTLIHSSGEWIGSVLTLTPKDISPQGIGSTITYGRRYALGAIVGIAADDDDGNAASAKGAVKELNDKYDKQWEERKNAASARGKELEKKWEEKVAGDPKNAPAFPKKQGKSINEEANEAFERAR